MGQIIKYYLKPCSIYQVKISLILLCKEIYYLSLDVLNKIIKAAADWQIDICIITLDQQKIMKKI